MDNHAQLPADPSVELEQLRMDRMNGKINDLQWRGEKAARFEQLAQASASSNESPAITQELARTKLVELRDRRLAGSVSDRDFATEMVRLGPIAAGEPPDSLQAPSLSIEENLLREVDALMAGAQPHEYLLPPFHAEPTGESVQWDNDMRSAMSAAEIPKHLGGPIFESINNVAGRLANASPSDRDAAIQSTAMQLHASWGDQFDKRLDAIDELIFTATEKHPRFAEIIYSAPWLLADPALLTHLDTVAQHRVNKRARG